MTKHIEIPSYWITFVSNIFNQDTPLSLEHFIVSALCMSSFIYSESVQCTHLCGFKNECVSSCEAGSTLPRQHHERVVPWDDDGTHTATENTQHTWAWITQLNRVYSNTESEYLYPRGSFLVKVRLRLGLAWLMGIVLPCNKQTPESGVIISGYKTAVCVPECWPTWILSHQPAKYLKVWMDMPTCVLRASVYTAPESMVSMVASSSWCSSIRSASLERFL